ncbi:hypothetical protein H4R33_005390 [Dimargaris cristalligena]|uniref:GATA-type domain-containing protein n=1 Tax=Dimargaris cristalligena TaxID=215637 RepID=A0A4V1J5Q6_9FUNG|nr:hypothetical protein H4R33_005390 [Dimargaris cristalligena]RKP39889.1 hypothetical protein BJ085DRAFT_28891 [Dimargaris cristalligena]|eukprot:RKP39889.1 hypothetical protein BJ085DRAFT_28891 [Dimargaris cristalligena]
MATQYMPMPRISPPARAPVALPSIKELSQRGILPPLATTTLAHASTTPLPSSSTSSSPQTYSLPSGSRPAWSASSPSSSPLSRSSPTSPQPCYGLYTPPTSPPATVALGGGPARPVHHAHSQSHPHLSLGRRQSAWPYPLPQPRQHQHPHPHQHQQLPLNHVSGLVDSTAVLRYGPPPAVAMNAASTATAGTTPYWHHRKMALPTTTTGPMMVGVGCGPTGPSPRATAAHLMRKCTHCQTTTTRAWRPGPKGSATLCDRCGKKYKRKLAHYGRSASPVADSPPSTRSCHGPHSSPVSAHCTSNISSSPEFSSVSSLASDDHSPPPSEPTSTHHHQLFLQLLN